MQPDKYGSKTLESFEPVIGVIVRDLVTNPTIWDDCKQEARIIVWRILNDRPDASRPYIHKAIANRVRNAAFYGQITGLTNPSGKTRDPLRGKFESLDDLGDKGFDAAATAPLEDPLSDESLTAQMVRDAVVTLPEKQRHHVVKVFYLGYSHRQSGPIGHRWYPAREKLRNQLKDLAA